MWAAPHPLARLSIATSAMLLAAQEMQLPPAPVITPRRGNEFLDDTTYVSYR